MIYNSFQCFLWFPYMHVISESLIAISSGWWLLKQRFLICKAYVFLRFDVEEKQDKRCTFPCNIVDIFLFSTIFPQSRHVQLSIYSFSCRIQTCSQNQPIPRPSPPKRKKKKYFIRRVSVSYCKISFYISPPHVLLCFPDLMNSYVF